MKIQLAMLSLLVVFPLMVTAGESSVSGAEEEVNAKRDSRAIELDAVRNQLVVNPDTLGVTPKTESNTVHQRILSLDKTVSSHKSDIDEAWDGMHKKGLIHARPQ